MITDERLIARLRTTVPPVAVGAREPRRDLWSDVVARGQNPHAWSWLDLGLAAGAATLLLLRPDLIVLLMYHF